MQRLLHFGVFDGQQWRSEYALARGFLAAGVGSVQAFNTRFADGWTEELATRATNAVLASSVIFIQQGLSIPPPVFARILATAAGGGKRVILFASEAAAASVVGHHAQIELLAARIQDPTPLDCMVLVHAAAVRDYITTTAVPFVTVPNGFNDSQYGVDAPMKRPPLVTPDERFDFVFVGALTPRRDRVLRDLQRATGDCRWYVGSLDNPAAINWLYNNTRYVVHIHAEDGIAYLPTRAFEAMPCRSVLLREAGADDDAAPEGAGTAFDAVDAELAIAHWAATATTEAAYTKRLQRSMAAAPANSWAARAGTFVRHFNAFT